MIDFFNKFHVSHNTFIVSDFGVLTSVIPNWKEFKSRLDEMAGLYLNE